MEFINFNDKKKNSAKDKFFNLGDRDKLKQLSKETKIKLSELKKVYSGSETGSLNFYNKISKAKIIQRAEKYSEIEPAYNKSVDYMAKQGKNDYLVVFKYRGNNKFEYKSIHINKKMLKYYDKNEIIEQFLKPENEANKNKYGNLKLLGYSVKTSPKKYDKETIQAKTTKKAKRNK